MFSIVIRLYLGMVLIAFLALVVVWASGIFRIDRYDSFSYHVKPKRVGNLLFFEREAWQLCWEKHPRFVLRRIPYRRIGKWMWRLTLATLRRRTT